MKTPHTVETVKKIWHDHDGWYVKVRPNRDGLDLVEISLVESDGEISRNLTLPSDMARTLGKVLIELPEEEAPL